MGTFSVQADINKLLDRVGLTDDWVGAVVDAFVIDYVFDRPSEIAETMEELAPPTCKFCGDPYSAAPALPLRDRLCSVPLPTVPSDVDAHLARDVTGYWVTRSAVALTQRVPRDQSGETSMWESGCRERP